jgi:hypothetical protein
LAVVSTGKEHDSNSIKKRYRLLHGNEEITHVEHDPGFTTSHPPLSYPVLQRIIIFGGE